MAGPGGAGRPGAPRGVGCTLGPGCGCLGLPLAALAGVALASVVALAWVANILRLLGVGVAGVRGAFGGRRRRGPGAT